ncbi:secretion system protein [Candidatus Pacearchaeota archaeon CG10_big_fil_rev_8_21_14_0_10_34_76]|nr:MAG: secretion system protein [Candidatus Pacearchaeota archaeon CG10_big_fil_rev_8_21_14_0_10_34_76]
MIFNQGSPLYAVEIDHKEGENIMYINYFGAPFVPSLARYGEVMARTISSIIENPNVSRVVFVQQRNYNYPFEQVEMLVEIAQLFNFLTKQEKVLSPERLSLFGDVGQFHGQINYLMGLLQSDPVACYLEMGNIIRGISGNSQEYRDLNSKGYLRFLERIKEMVENTKIIKLIKDVIDTYYVGDRSVYDQIFRPDVMPNFTFTRLVAQLPKDAKLVDQYEIEADDENITVTILKKEDATNHIYHIMPPEYNLDEDHHLLLNLGKNVLIEHQPKAEEFTDPERTRSIFLNVAKDLLRELAENKNVSLSYRELNKLARILVRQTIGSGLVEVLLLDEKLQDIFLNSPIAQNPIFVRHEEHGECITNIIPSYEDADSWASKLRLQSGRPLDEANPILDTDLFFGNVRARVAAIQRPLSPNGLAYAIRRHRDQPWTLPLFIRNKMINPIGAGIVSFMIDGSRTLLVAGTRSSGKTSFLGSSMLEIMPKTRTIVIEDTLELPVEALRKIGYNIQRMKVRSALTESSTEVEASEGIRASLRLGDSALIVGEVRSTEAKALYEAMRVGALANVVAGTIHGASPYGVFDRLVNDLNVPITSFKATDLILIANPIKTPDGMHSMKRVLQLAEVRKHWTKDPLEEKGFVDLLRYNVEKDELEPTEELMNGDSEVIKDIASNVRGWAGNWDAVYDNILLRGKVKQEIVNVAEIMKMPELLEAKFNSSANDAFHRISDEITREIGVPLSERVFPDWKNWLMSKVKKN